MATTKKTELDAQGDLFNGNTGPVRDAQSALESQPTPLGSVGDDGTEAIITEFKVGEVAVPVYTHEYWTARQRQAANIHEVSYRACFKPQLPRYFIERLTTPGALVYDPFMGRGTTIIEAALLGRRVAGCDVNPLSVVLTRPRLDPPSLEAIRARLAEIDLTKRGEEPEELLAFYHPETLREIGALRRHLIEREAAGPLDAADDWIRMVAVNRLTGHSPGFFSVYSMPPNQAVSVGAQLKINEKRNQSPPRREIAPIILKKSKSLLKEMEAADLANLRTAGREAILLTGPADATPLLAEGSVDLVVTSPPFLAIVQYALDNWLRCWFCGIDASKVDISETNSVKVWSEIMRKVFMELHRALRPGGHVAFEVGEVKKGKVRLEEAVLPVAMQAGFDPACVMINAQDFTKTANCWGIDNGAKGTNTNRIVVLRKP